jgi:murein DD-endopeptidase MepM/ murein hydrolase activator NlpD
VRKIIAATFSALITMSLITVHDIPLLVIRQPRRIYAGFCAWRIPRWVNFIADSRLRPGADTLDILLAACGRRWRPAWPARAMVSAVLVTALSTTGYTYAASPAKAAQRVTVPAAATVQQDLRAAGAQAQLQASAGTLASLRPLHLGASTRMLRAGVRHTPSASQIRAIKAAAAAAAARARAAAAAAAAAAAQTQLSSVTVTGSVWDCIAHYEGSPPGNWATNTGNGYEGGLQITPGNWVTYGGLAYAPHAYDASAKDQIAVAERILAAQGWGAWPVSSKACGLSGAAYTASYLNPLRGISWLVAQRIDQGVDYSGSGPIYALGPGVIVETWNSGWPGGAFIDEQMTAGPLAGRYVYAAENITPTVSVGQQVSASTQIGTLNGAGIETGFAAAPPDTGATAAAVAGEPLIGSGYGYEYSNLLASLGAPPGNGAVGAGPRHHRLPPWLRTKRQRAFHWAISQHGKPYEYGQTGPYGYDCSGLIYRAYVKQGYRNFPRATYDMLASSLLVRTWHPRAGDLAFYGSGHVEFVTLHHWRTFGALEPGTVVWWHGISGWWHPTMYFHVRGAG